MDAAHAAVHGGSAVVELGQHAAADEAAGYEFIRLGSRNPGDKALPGFVILVDSLNVRKKCQLLRFHSLCDGAGRIVRIDVVGPEVFVQADGGYDRQKIFFQ